MIFIFIKINNTLSEEEVYIKRTSFFAKTYSWENEIKYSKFRKISFKIDTDNLITSKV